MQRLTMGFSQVVLATVTDVEDVGDLQRFYHVGILSVVPVAEPKSPRENLIRITVSDLARK